MSRNRWKLRYANCYWCSRNNILGFCSTGVRDFFPAVLRTQTAELKITKQPHEGSQPFEVRQRRTGCIWVYEEGNERGSPLVATSSDWLKSKFDISSERTTLHASITNI